MNSLMQWIKAHKIAAAIGTAGLALVFVFKVRANRRNADTLSDPTRKGSIIESVYGVGTITATRSFQVKSGVTSTIRRLFVKEGDFVKRGSPLVDIDGASVIEAPFDGTVTSLPFKVGESVFSQTVVLSLVDLTDRYIVVSLEQQAAVRVRRGQNAKLSFEGMRDKSYDGVVKSVYSSDSNLLVRIDAPHLPEEILPGMTADVAVGISERSNVMIVPVAALDKGRVYAQRGRGSPQTVEVKTGIVDGAMAEVISGDIREGDRLVIHKKVGP